MFNKLQQKWNVTSLQLFWILCTFAVTGTTTAYISRSITAWVGFGEHTFWAWKLALRLFILVFGYQFIILVVSFFFGQFSFFWNYEKKILRRIGLLPKEPVRLAIFASGKGSNAEKIIQYFENHKFISVALIASNKPDAGVIQIANEWKIPVLLLEKNDFNKGNNFIQLIDNHNITHIVLAGFLWKIPDALIQKFPRKIINIHPALLPAYGGKGMYGDRVHKAVLDAGEKKSGISIHLVDEEYDHGKTIFQESIEINPGETPDTLAGRIHQLEHKHFPRIIEKWASK